MTEISFDVALQRGLGRAILSLCERGDGAAHRDAILHACRNNLAYDPQIEGDRGQYLVDVLEASGDLDWHLPRLREALWISDFYFDQLADICGRLTKRGIADFRKDLYDAWNLRFASGSEDGGSHTDGAEVLIRLDGAEGWRFVARRLLESPLSEDESWLVESFFDELRETLGRKAARHADDGDLALRGEIARLLHERRSLRKTRRKRPPVREFSEAEVRALLESDENRSALAGVGRGLSEEIFVALAKTPPAPNESPDRVRRWLRLFWPRPYPLDPAPILALTQHTDLLVSRQAFRALARVAHPAVREFAENLAESDSPLRAKVGDLLATNPGDGDREILRRVWQSLENEDEIHDFGFGLTAYFDAHPETWLDELLVSVYEKTPCSSCRGSIARRLVKSQLVPGWLLDEIRWDSDEDTRTLI